MPLQPLVYWLAIEHDVEDIRRYMTGGFHPIILGDVMNCRLFFLCCLYWVAWLVLRACLRNSIVRHRLHLTVWHVSGRDGGALCWSAVVLEELLGVQRELSHYAYVLWKLSFWTYLHWPGISHEAADSAWQLKLGSPHELQADQRPYEGRCFRVHRADWFHAQDESWIAT